MGALDRTRPFGTVCGAGVGYTYEQDGKFFDGMGNEVYPDKIDPEPWVEEKPEEETPAETPDTNFGDESFEEESQEPTQEVTLGEDEIDTTPDRPEPIQKRKRGRPPKNKDDSANN